MESDQESDKQIITTEYLDSLDKGQLIDILAHKTGLLIKATVLKLPDHVYISQITEEVKKIQESIRAKS